MKKVISFLVFSTIIISWTSIIFAWGDKYDSWYKAPILDKNLDFKAVRDWSNIKMSWNKYNQKEELKYYKLVRWENNPNPIYPDDWYIKYDSSIDFTSFEYKDEKGAYYRICAITQNNNRYCSNIVKVGKYENKNDSKVEEKQDYKDKKNVEKIDKNKNQLNIKVKLKLELLVNTYIKKLDKLINESSKKSQKIDLLINKFEELKKQNSKLEKHINYIIDLLEEKQEDYLDDLSKIEDILNESLK